MDPVKLSQYEDFGEEAEGYYSDVPIFSARKVSREQFNTSGQQRMVAVAAANCTVLTGFQFGDVVRWFSAEDEMSVIEFSHPKCSDVSRILLEPKGFHALITSKTGDSWYLNFQNSQAKSLPKLKGHIIEAVSWDPDSTADSTKNLIVGTMGGHLLHVVIENNKERIVKNLFAFDSGEQRKQLVCGVHRERTISEVDGGERVVLFVAAGSCLYGFVGTSIETLFQKYIGEGGAAKALVFEVPFESPSGELHIDAKCDCGSSSDERRAEKELFWLTGVGVLAADVNTPIPADNALLESPPGLIKFPPSKKATNNVARGDQWMPPPPPPAPISMALTRFHIIFIFEDRWAVVSRVNHELVQQEDWTASFSGALRGLARDLHGEGVWMCSEQHMFEMIPEKEDRNVWALLLQLAINGKAKFEDALDYCGDSIKRRVKVLEAHADWLFRKGRLLESAKKFAECSECLLGPFTDDTVPFEHVALRFIRTGNRAALFEYFRARLDACQPSDNNRVTRCLLGVFAVEIALAHLNNLKQAVAEAVGARADRFEKSRSPSAALDEARNSLRDLLKSCTDLGVHTTIYHLLRSHGWLEELTLFAEWCCDFEEVILHHVSRCDYANAINKLEEFLDADDAASRVSQLVRRFAPVLFGAEPRAFVHLFMRMERKSVNLLSILPAVYTPRASAKGRLEAVRCLEYIVRRFPGDVRGSSTEAEGRIAADSFSGDLVSGVGEACDDHNSIPPRSWATGTGILNALTFLLSANPGHADGDGMLPKNGGAEDKLLDFFKSQDGNDLFDKQFALRVCSERDLKRAEVQLYGLMGNPEEAVGAALAANDITLAKSNASRPAELALKQKLWLRIVEYKAKAGNVQAITELIQESKILTVRDVLPHMSDAITIDTFQAEICECLDTFEGQIQTLRQEMHDHRHALDAFKKELKQSEKRCVTIAENQICEICGGPAIRERFYVFACQHCFHEACLRALVCPTLSEERQARLMTLEATRVDHQAAAAGAVIGGVEVAGSTSLAEVEDELDGILADDCPLCGRLMIQTIRRPLFDLPREQNEVDSWAID